jgi:hypothetical protein
MLEKAPGQTLLVEAVARRLHDEVLDAALFEIGREPVQRDRIGRRQRALRRAASPLQAQRAEACRRDAEQVPDLAGEARDGGLAIGAGDGGREGRLDAVERGREPGQPAPRIRVDDDRDETVVGLGTGAAEHRHGTSPECFGDEGVAVGLRPGESREKRPGRDGAAVGRKPRDGHVLQVEHARSSTAASGSGHWKPPGFLSE